MTELDSMVNAACKSPEDGTIRGALADMIREQRVRYELADAVEGDTGLSLLKETADLGNRLSLPLSYELLWTAYAVMPRMKPETSSLPPIVVPYDPPREWVPSRPVGEWWDTGIRDSGNGGWTYTVTNTAQ